MSVAVRLSWVIDSNDGHEFGDVFPILNDRAQGA